MHSSVSKFTKDRRVYSRRAWYPTPVFLPGESHGQRSLVGYIPWDRRESDTTEVTEHSTESKFSENLPSLLLPQGGVQALNLQ